VSERLGCAVLRFHRRTHRYKSIRYDQVPLRKRIKEIADTRVRYGYRRIHVLLRREGWAVNVKRVHWLYRLEGLNLRSKKPRRHVMAARRVERPLASRPNEIWAMDFVSDALFNGKRFLALTVVDAFTRECLAIDADQGIQGEVIAKVMERLTFQRGAAPTKIRVGNDPEFISRALDQWAYMNMVTLDFSRPGKPKDNAFVEFFNGRFRDECLNTYRFLSLDDARSKIETWRLDYNKSRPHTSLGFMTPAEFVSSAGVNPSR
jgi:putative transposase